MYWKALIICGIELGFDRSMVVTAPSSISIIGYFVWIINILIICCGVGIDSVTSMCDLLSIRFVIGNCGVISSNIVVNISSISVFV